MSASYWRTDLTQQSALCVVKAQALASAVPILVSTKATDLSVNMVPSDTEEDNSEDEASTASTPQSAQEAPTVAKTPSPINIPADNEALTGLTAGEFYYKSSWLLTRGCVDTHQRCSNCTVSCESEITLTDCQMNQIRAAANFLQCKCDGNI